jgi:hypothetical protein
MTRPKSLEFDAAKIPQELRNIPRWVMWRYVEQKKGNGSSTWAKLPFSTMGTRASTTKPSTWTTFDAAVDAYLGGNYSGIGLVLGNDVQGIDLDDHRDPVTGELSELAMEILLRVSGYAEVSPSGTGIKIFTRGNLERSRTDHGKGVELYCKSRYFTVTGSVIEGHENLPSQVQDLSWLVSKVFDEKLRLTATTQQDAGVRALAFHKEPIDGWDLDRVINELLPNLDPDSGYNDWLQVGQAMHHQGQGDVDWLDGWDEWSAGSIKYKTGECELKWKSFSKQRYDGGVISIATLIKRIKDERIKLTLGVQIERHPLLEFRDLKNPPSAVPRYVIPNFIAEGLVVIAGAHGIGKTNAVLPLALVAAGIHSGGDPLAPRHWRHVIFISEDPNQAYGIIRGLTEHDSGLLDVETVSERLHLVESLRMSVDHVVQVGDIYRERFTRVVDGVELKPLVVIDTKSALIEFDDENDNATASKIVAALKQQFAGLPTWVIGHIAKASLGRTDVDSLSMRGSSSFEADACQVLYLIKDKDDTRYLVRGKTRFESTWPELKVESLTTQVVEEDVWGDLQSVTLRWSHLVPSDITRAQRMAKLSQAEKAVAAEVLKKQILDIVAEGQKTGKNITRTMLRDKVNGRHTSIDKALKELLESGDLVQETIPKADRLNSQQKCRLLVREKKLFE